MAAQKKTRYVAHVEYVKQFKGFFYVVTDTKNKIEVSRVGEYSCKKSAMRGLRRALGSLYQKQNITIVQ